VKEEFKEDWGPSFLMTYREGSKKPGKRVGGKKSRQMNDLSSKKNGEKKGGLVFFSKRGAGANVPLITL